MTCEEPESQNISCSTKSRNSDRLKAARQHLGISTLPSIMDRERRKHQRIQRKTPSTSLKGSSIGSVATKNLKFSNYWSTSSHQNDRSLYGLVKSLSPLFFLVLLLELNLYTPQAALPVKCINPCKPTPLDIHKS